MPEWKYHASRALSEQAAQTCPVVRLTVRSRTGRRQERWLCLYMFFSSKFWPIMPEERTGVGRGRIWALGFWKPCYQLSSVSSGQHWPQLLWTLHLYRGCLWHAILIRIKRNPTRGEIDLWGFYCGIGTEILCCFIKSYKRYWKRLTCSKSHC